ncbi:MAG TPA: hypothetical protein VHZ81_01110 [Galbitalea sp.]|nr:hypothetical protein [Galbitalea sp.]
MADPQYKHNDPDQDADLRRAMGEVVHNSAMVSQQLQMVGELVSGTGLLYFVLEEQTLGAQLNAVERMALATNWNEYVAHRPLAEQHRQGLLDLFKQVRKLSEYRNRIVHDIWWVFPTDEFPDAIEGVRATRWGKKDAQSTITSVRTLASVMGSAASALSSYHYAIAGNRDGQDLGVTFHEPSPHPQVRSTLESMRNGTLANWRWVEQVPGHGRPSTVNEPKHQ